MGHNLNHNVRDKGFYVCSFMNQDFLMDVFYSVNDISRGTLVSCHFVLSFLREILLQNLFPCRLLVYTGIHKYHLFIFLFMYM